MKDLRSRWFALVVLAALGSLLGCATLQGGAAQNRSNESGSLLVFNSNLNFGQVVVGQSKALNATVMNRTVFGVTITQADISGADFQVVWPRLPIRLRPGQAVNFRIRFAPREPGTPTATVAIMSSARQPAITISLAGEGITLGEIAASPANLSFGSVRVGQQSSKPVTFANSGSTDLTVSQLSVNGTAFQGSNIAVPFTLAPGETKVLNVIFAPKSAGAANGSVVVNAAAETQMDVRRGARTRGGRFGSPDVQGESVTIPLSGTGMGSGQLAANPGSVNFGSMQVNTSASRTVVLQNATDTAVSITQATVSGAGFTMTGLNTPATVAPGQSASFTVTFAPKAAGNATGNVAITSNATNSSLNVALSGSSTSPGVLTTGSNLLPFGNVQVGSNQKQTATITNTGGSSVTINQSSITGAGFTLSGMTTPVTVNAGQSTSFSVTFAPQSAGNASGSVSVTSSASSQPMTWTLSGTGVAPGSLTASPSSLSFGSVQTSSSKSLEVTLSNSGGSSLTVNQISATGAFSVNGLSLPSTINAGESKSFNVVFTPTSSGSANGTLSVSNSASGSALTVALSGTGLAPGSLTSSPSSLSFGSVQTGSTKTLQETITNSGGTSVTVNQISATGAYSVTGATLPMTLGAGENASFNVVFSPTAGGNANGTLTVTSNAPGSPMTVALSGSGTTPGSLTASPSTLSFGSVQTGSTKTLQETITNSGGTSITVNQISATGAYSVTGATLPMTLGAGQNASFNVVFSPTAGGNANGTLTVTSNAAGSPMTVALSGSGTTPGSLNASPSSLSFGSVQTGSTKTLQETISNSGGTSITVNQISATGAYSVTGATLPMTLGAGQNASFNVVFSPTAGGNANGTLTVSSNAPGSPMTVALSGSGSTPGSLTVSSSSLNFGSVQTGTSKTMQETLTNSGGSSVTVSQATVTGTGFGMNGLTLPLTLAAGATKTFNVTFTPTGPGNATGSLAINSNASNASMSVSLSGAGLATGTLSVSPTSLSFGTVNVANNSTKQATVTNTGGASVTISQVNVTGSAYKSTGLSLPLTLDAGENFTFNIVFTPTSAGAVSGSVAFVSDASNTVPSISLSGTGAAVGGFSIAPTNFSFGSVTVGSSKNLTVTLSATGGNVSVTAASVSSAEFKLTGPALPLTINSGQTATFTITFTPQSSGSASANVSFTTNASSTPVTGNLSGSGTAPVQHSVTLNWTSSSGAAGYNVYRSSVSGSGYVRINSSLNSGTFYTDTTVQSGKSYFYVSTAVDASGSESGFSNEAQAVIPTP